MGIKEKLVKKVEPKYDTKDLYVGLLGVVDCECERFGIITKLTITSANRYIIYKKIKLYESSGWYGEYVGQDLFTDKEYFFFGGNRYEQKTIQHAIGGYAIYKSFPLEVGMKAPKDVVTKSELLDMYKQLNYRESEEKIKGENSNEEVEDTILKTILDTNKLVEEASIDDKLKRKIVQDLGELGKYYVDEMIKVTENRDKGLTFEDEYSVRMNVIKRLVEIESNIKNPSCVKSYSLKKQYNQFKKDLNNQ